MYSLLMRHVQQGVAVIIQGILGTWRFHMTQAPWTQSRGGEKPWLGLESLARAPALQPGPCLALAGGAAQPSLGDFDEGKQNLLWFFFKVYI